MPQPNRNFDSQEYRYGFQGQEKDSEIKGEGLSVNYKYRMHDPRVGRFFAVDPLTKEFPHYSPYSFGGNRAVAFKELEGAEELISIIPTGQQSPDMRNLKGELIEEIVINAAERITEEGTTWVIKAAVNSARNEIKAGKLIFSNGIEHTTTRLHLEPEIISFEGEAIKTRQGVDWKYAGADGVQNSSRAINQLSAQINKNKGVGRLFGISKAIKQASGGVVGLGEVISFVWTAASTGELDPFALQPIPTFMLAMEKEEMTKQIEQDVISEFDQAIQGGLETATVKLKEWNHNFLKDFELFNVSTRTLLLIDLKEISEYSDLFEKTNPYEDTPHVLLIKHDKTNDKMFIVTRFIDTNNLEQEIEEEE